MSYTINELKASLAKVIEHNEEWGPLEDDVENALYGTRSVETPEGRVTIPEQRGGEGEGDEYWYILKVEGPDETRHFKVEGYYSSYDGVNWGYSEWVEVKAVPVTRDEWVSI